ncbi:hypothetical protein ACNKHM_22770 [Shigella sonnei]
MFGTRTEQLWLLNTSGMTGFIAWLGIAISHYRFRLAGTISRDTTWSSPVPLPVPSHSGPILRIHLCRLSTLGQNYSSVPERYHRRGGSGNVYWYPAVPDYLVRLQAVKELTSTLQRNEVPAER